MNIRSGTGCLLRYDSFQQVGEGTYGYVFKLFLNRFKNKSNRHVFKARDREDHGRHVALKRLVFHRDSLGVGM